MFFVGLKHENISGNHWSNAQLLRAKRARSSDRESGFDGFWCKKKLFRSNYSYLFHILFMKIWEYHESYWSIMFFQVKNTKQLISFWWVCGAVIMYCNHVHFPLFCQLAHNTASNLFDSPLACILKKSSKCCCLMWTWLPSKSAWDVSWA